LRGVKKTLKSLAYKQSKFTFLLLHNYVVLKGECRRTFCIMGQRVNLYSLLKPIGVGIAKASLFKGQLGLVVQILPETG
jgi:hypothetical protein